MKNLKLIGLVALIAIIIFSCKREIVPETKKYPGDVELFNHSRDAEIATKKPPKPPKGGGGNPHNPPDTTTNPPVDTAEVCIYLDYDGEILSGTLWNINYGSGNTLVFSPSGLSDTQKQEIRVRVSADYAKEKGFVKRIKITDSLSVFNSYPKSRRMQVIITASHEWYPESAGGVAYINSYTWGDGTPCFVFSKAYDYRADYIAHACSHEPGHMTGCRHQSVYDSNCNLVNNYRVGWIMGQYGGYPAIFGIGTSICCTCIQDDIAVINSNL